MNAKSAAILTNPHPCGHIVYPYTDELLVSEAVSLFAGSGLRNGEGVILIMTKAHCDSITSRLKSEGFEIEALAKLGRLFCISAEELLSVIMVDEAPDPDIFSTVVGRMITRSRMSTGKGAAAKVRAFGEMVSLIWNSDLGATISLEEMWNAIIDKHRVSLMCTYALNGRDRIPDSLQLLHSHSMPVD